MKADIKNVEHIRICGGKNVVCHWPLFGGIWYLGDDEIVLGHIHAPCQYKDPEEVGHGPHNIWERAVVRLQRSRDLGRTWPEEESQVLYDYTLSEQEQRARLHLDEYTATEEPEREFIDMRQPDAIMAFGWTYTEFLGQEHYMDVHGKTSCTYLCWGFRSPDRGHTWEKVPSIIWPNHTNNINGPGNGYLKQPDGTLMGWFNGSSSSDVGETRPLLSPQVYMSIDHGVRWHWVSEIWCDPTRRTQCAYPNVVPLPSGRLLCSLGMLMRRYSDVRWISIAYSDDGGLTWSEPRRINRWGISPYPVLLEDGRIVILYTRRHTSKYGMFCMVSEDEGRTWSDEIVLRDDAAPGKGVWIRGDGMGHGWRGTDGGYPVAVQLRDGRIFTAYYYQLEEEDVPWRGGRKFIAGTFLELK